MRGPLWKQWQVEYLRENYRRLPMKTLYFVLKRTKQSVISKAYELGLSKKLNKGQAAADEYFQLINNKATEVGVRPLELFAATGRSKRASPLIHLKHEVWVSMWRSGKTHASIAAASGHDRSTISKVVRRIRNGNPSVPTGDSSAQFAAHPGKEAPSREIPSTSTFERLAVSQPCSQPELREAAE